MTRKQRRLAFLALGLTILALATGLVLGALRDTIVVFYGPKDAISRLESGELKPGQRIRLGGFVAKDSLQYDAEKHVRFAILDAGDHTTTITVTYGDILPDLMREGQGVVAQGAFGEGKAFTADLVLAKHDEKYMPPEIVNELKKSGRWREGEGYVPPETTTP
ncbi:MAG: cytochrome c maturation protein CcmE [Micropepsaceae bacterium]